ncbi:hypothetical protein RHRU231_930016 [Rhodococcus ruber]|uniref:Uncharacterized protein n=1 Tax=Rhodococcus ruber TaxID=1830 RepID=A0A098BVB3_9NOCA|nr:hypothetical protein RHRU231_930016 [Rhodococcus ruber]
MDSRRPLTIGQLRQILTSRIEIACSGTLYTGHHLRCAGGPCHSGAVPKPPYGGAGAAKESEELPGLSGSLERASIHHRSRGVRSPSRD